MMCVGVVRIQRDGPAQRAFGAGPIPVPEQAGDPECSVRFAQRGVEREGAVDQRAQLAQSFFLRYVPEENGGREDARLSGVCTREGRRSRSGAIEELERLPELIRLQRVAQVEG